MQFTETQEENTILTIIFKCFNIILIYPIWIVLYEGVVNMTSEQVIEKLKNDGCRITKQRKLIIDVIMNNNFNSCKDIYYQVTEKDKTVGMATVYRMIRQLEDMGIVNRIDTIEIVK